MKLEFRSFVGEYDWGWVQQQVPILRIEDTCGLMAIDTEKNETKPITKIKYCLFIGLLYKEYFLYGTAKISNKAS